MKRLFSGILLLAVSLLITSPQAVGQQSMPTVCGMGFDNNNCRVVGSVHYSPTPNSGIVLPGHLWVGMSNGMLFPFFQNEVGGVFTENLPIVEGNLLAINSNDVVVLFSPSFDGNRNPEEDTIYNILTSDTVTPSALAKAFAFVDNTDASCTTYPLASSPRITGFIGCDDGRLFAVRTLFNGSIVRSEISTAPFDFGQTDLQFRFREIVIPANSGTDNAFAIVQDGSSRSVYRYDSVSAEFPNNNIWVEVANFDESQNINNLRVVNTDLGEMVAVFSETTQETVFTRGGVRTSFPCRIEGNLIPFGANCRFTEGNESNLVFLNFPDQLVGDFTVTDVENDQRFPVLVTMSEVRFSDGTFSSRDTLRANVVVGTFVPFPQNQVDVPTENPGSPTTGSDTPMMVEEENVEIVDGPVLTTGTDGSGIDAGILGGLAVVGLVGASIYGGSDDDDDSTGIGSFGLFSLLLLLIPIRFRRFSLK